MDICSPALIGSGSSAKVALKRQYRSAELKRKIVEESLAPGASVARIARAYGVNANQVFAWRQKYRQGLLPAARNQTAGLLAVRVTEAAGVLSPTTWRRYARHCLSLARAKKWHCLRTRSLKLLSAEGSMA